jgi:hypothetical protein
LCGASDGLGDAEGAADFASAKRRRCRTRAGGSVRNLGLGAAEPVPRTSP